MQEERQRTTAPFGPALRLLWLETRGERLRYGGALLALLPGAALLAIAPLIPQAVLDHVLADDGAPPGPISGALIELLGGADRLRADLWIAMMAIFAVTLAAGAFTYLRGRWAARASEAIIRRLRDRLYDHLQRLPVSWHHTANTGDLIQRCTSDVETIRNFLASQVVEIGRALAMFLVPLPLMLALDPRMTLAAVVLMPGITGFSYLFFRRVRSAFLAVDEAEGAMTGVLQENLVGIRVVRAFSRQEHEEERFAERNSRHRLLDRTLYRHLSVFWSVSDFFCFLQLAIVIGYGGLRLLDGTLETGAFYFFLAVVNLFLWPMRFMGRILTEFGKATVAISRVGEILASEIESQPDPALVTAEDRREEERASEGDAAGRRGAIVFDAVAYHPGDEQTPILDGVDFRIAAGETIALLGASGSGKSTIARLLLRFIDPDRGRILLDGRDIATLPRSRVRSRIAVVLQDPFLYSKTVRENIHLGRTTASEADIERAATESAIHDSIAGFHDGYETTVGERGVTLSGGQRQRVALARALIDEPDILILDDALSAVDTDTESEIIETLRRRSGAHTTLIIAHRLSTLMHADRILVLERGRIAQSGSHVELSRADGIYRRLWKLESALEEELADGGEPSSGSPEGSGR